MTKTEFATLLKITVRRVNQQIAAGLIVLLPDGSVDTIPSLLALLAEAKAKNSTGDARARLIEAQLRGAELRGQRLLRKLITVDELEEILRVHLDEGFTLAQNAGGELFYRLITILSENEARTAGYAVLRSLQQLFRTERDAAKELCDKLRAETLPDKVRLAAVYRSLLALPGLEDAKHR